MRVLSAVALLSAAALSFEVLLVRMFSIAQWHHFAYMIISLALLGYGASGSFLSFARERLLTNFPLAFAGSAALFGLSVPVGFALSQTIPLNVLEIAWDPAQQLHLLLIYVILAVPFFCAATGIGLALAAVGENVGVVYRSDLVGAGIGALAVVGGLWVVPPGECLKAIGAIGLSAAVIAGWHDRVPKALPAILIVAAVALIWAWPQGWAKPKLSPYKELSLALLAPDAEIVAERSSPLGLLTVVRSPTIPFHYAPGLSLVSGSEPPEQLGVFTDGGAMTAIARFDGRLDAFRYLDEQTSALPFHLLDRPRVAILGSGTGIDTLLARMNGSRSIDAVEINPQMIDLVQRQFAEFAGGVYSDPDISLHTTEARSFVAGTEKSFDLIHVALLDSFAAASAGLHALNESTLYTVEAFDTYLNKLAAGGFLAVTRWLRVPPRDGLKMFAIAVGALERRGVVDPGRHLALIRGWQTVTLLVKNGVLTGDEIAEIREFCRIRAFDVAYYPGMDAAEANRYSVLERPYLFEGAVALIGPNREQFLADYGFDVSPSTDDRPYFFHFLKWRTMAELMQMPNRSGFNLIEWGYPVLLATLAQAIVASTVLILLPLVARRRRSDRPKSRLRRWGRLRVATFFFALGLAFLFIEIAFIQRFQLFLGHPTYAVSVVLCGFLVFAGLGSGSAKQCTAWLEGDAVRTVAVAVAAIALLSLTYIAILPSVFETLGRVPAPAKIVATLGLIAPLAFFMGMPFPLGLADTAIGAPELVPWAWGINGCASVLSAVLATLLAIDFGFSWVVVLALVLYGIAAAMFPAAAHLVSPNPVGDASPIRGP
jgi:SAM-dependent methyltransferase